MSTVNFGCHSLSRLANHGTHATDADGSFPVAPMVSEPHVAPMGRCSSPLMTINGMASPNVMSGTATPSQLSNCLRRTVQISQATSARWLRTCYSVSVCVCASDRGVLFSKQSAQTPAFAHWRPHGAGRHHCHDRHTRRDTDVWLCRFPSSAGALRTMPRQLAVWSSFHP